MDIGFHRRAQARAAGLTQAPELARLLAKIAAKQAISPTARAVAIAAPALSSQPEIAPFVPGTTEEGTRAGTAVSFHPGVSLTILSKEQGL